jgi:hypothetical protein
MEKEAIMKKIIPVLLVAVAGCSQPAVPTLRSVLEHSARGVNAADGVVADGYEAADEDALRTSTTLDEYLAKMEAWNRAVDALLTAKAALVIAEAALDMWEAGNSGNVSKTFACLSGAVGELLGALEGVGIEVPSGVRMAAQFLVAFGAGEECRSQ